MATTCCGRWIWACRTTKPPQRPCAMWPPRPPAPTPPPTGGQKGLCRLIFRSANRWRGISQRGRRAEGWRSRRAGEQGSSIPHSPFRIPHSQFTIHNSQFAITKAASSSAAPVAPAGSFRRRWPSSPAPRAIPFWPTRFRGCVGGSGWRRRPCWAATRAFWGATAIPIGPHPKSSFVLGKFPPANGSIPTSSVSSPPCACMCAATANGRTMPTKRRTFGKRMRWPLVRH